MKHSPYSIWNLIIGLTYLAVVCQAARATSLILAKSKQVPQNTTVLPLDEIVPIPIPIGEVAGLNETLGVTVANNSKLTGVPQIDYVYDPNLPRELNGFNLTEYPFYVSIPEEIIFKCDGLHDGFYASVPHKCQVYHHCLFGTRYDFLCANYTAFDQKTFICHFASEVDCKNSPKYYNRNEALYKQATTTTLAPSTTTKQSSGDGNGRRRRPFRRRKPQYDYYDEYDEYGEDYADDDRRNKRPRTQSKETGSAESEESLPTAPNKSLYDRPRVAPKVRRPVPVNEREKYDYSGDARVISTKAPPPADPYPSEDEKTDKRKNKPRTQDSSVEDGKGKDRERYRDRYRGRDEDLEDERDKGAGREGERDRGRGRDEEDSADDDRLTRTRDDDSRERVRPRDEERDRPRNRRPGGKKRKRPENYDYYDDYEEVRRPKPRDRPRYEDEEDYDDRYYRKPVRSRNRDRERERERERDRYRPRDEDDRRSKPKNSEKPSRNRDYDEEEEDERYSKNSDTRGKDDGRRKGSGKENGRNNEDDDDGKVSKKQESSASSQREAVEPMPKRNQEKSKKSESQESSERESNSNREVTSTTEKFVENKARQSFIQRKTTTTQKPLKNQEPLRDETPLPASRPAYITTPQKTNRKQPEAPARKPSGFRRPTTQKYSEEEFEIQKEEISSKELISEPSTPSSIINQKKNSRPEIGNQNVRTTASTLQPEKTNAKDSNLKVPYEEIIDEDLAPRAPKLPFMSNKRRPFLPSRGGDPSLLRGLTPVGAKAFAPPRKEEERGTPAVPTPPSPPSPSSRERFSSRPVAVDPNKFPTGIEFRTKVQANVGVEQPRLSPSYQDDVSTQEEDYSGEVESEESRREDSHNYETQRKPVQSVKFTKQDATYNLRKPAPSERPVVSLRPALKPTDFPQLSSSVDSADVENSQEVKGRKYSSRLPQPVENKPTLQNTQYFSEVSQSKQTGYQQFGPQTFFSENPKFQTTVPLSEPPRPRPTSPNLNYNQGTQIPSFYQPIIKPGQGQVQVVHFQKNSPIEYSSAPSRKPAVKFPQPENLEDTDEYDVSFNDALQPISTLHPRNAQTGLINSQRTGSVPPARRRTAASGGQRFAESIIQPQFTIPNSAFRNFHNEFYSSFAK